MSRVALPVVLDHTRSAVVQFVKRSRRGSVVASSPDSGLELSVVDGRAVIKGEVDITCAARVEEWLGAFDGQLFEVDLSGVTFFDSSALRALLRVRRHHDGMRIVAASAPVLRVLEVTGTREYLTGDE
jgi:anti-anti-sigma factor